MKLFKSLILVLTITIQTHSLFAQKKNKIETVSAITIGTAYSNITDINGKSKIGLLAGLYKEYKLTEYFSFVTEINYLQLGKKSDITENNIRLHYLNLPLTFIINFTKKIGLLTGINSNILFASNKSKGSFKTTEWSLPIGLHYTFVDNLQLALRYNIGLYEIQKNEYTGNSLKNNWFSIGIMLVK